MIERVLPPEVATAWTTGDPDVPLFPEEAALVAGAVPSRRREFATGRHCARLALARLGVPATAITTGDRGQPVWPNGIVGSITHCAGYRAAAAARRDRLRAVGIDAEPHRPLPAEVTDMVLLPEEQADLARLAAADPAVHWPAIAFSAKESLYKAWFTLTERWLGFHDARLRFDRSFDRGGSFTAEIGIAAHTIEGTRVPPFAGNWHTDGSVIVTAVTAE
ncbi:MULTISPECIES: 4'-phosphopantetheinyl transferase family protein [Glycomyces]|uniref:4'-phosphopantetheinyl transferase EntD n=2 Tax=Glycomyces TaxID=58113 RepID=A0A9X3PGJ9_9ACTN|nr:4'-phosphopantetheinyl transferase superfamily protein [Glycomyces lechevalierae]MDA1385119.1 4'-phosphopantetheinyl transferase superfamily protein [Glycomyces lechevalierae]MDR7337267.1 4'-phosphopantetheinyl transferase EntD [Glycomyces lechevalierae]